MRLIEKVWFEQHRAKWLLVPLLLPLSLLFALITSLRRFCYRKGIFKAVQLPVPVVVVGNIGVGGNGKTPVTLFLVEQCQQRGINVGVVSRGYGSKAEHYPYQVTDASTAAQAGDEPLLIFQRCKVPVIIGSDRIKSCQLLIEQGCQIIIADDGLQHYRLARAYEFIVIDGKRGFGNGYLLPAGPLREGQYRLAQADALIINGGGAKTLLSEHKLPQPQLTMQLAATQVVQLTTGISLSFEEFKHTVLSTPEQKINALAGIGSPSRFFQTLRDYDFSLDKSQGFIDHQQFSLTDLQVFPSDVPLLMTEKDAVKCRHFAGDHCWYVPVDAVFDEKSIAPVLEQVLALAIQ